jgi:hypothetical protein
MEEKKIYIYIRLHIYTVIAIYQSQEVSVFIVMPFNNYYHIRILATKKEAKTTGE